MSNWLRLVLGFGALATLAITVPSAPVAAQDEEAVFDPMIDSTVRVRVDSTDKSGTGWVIQPIDNANRAGAAVVVTSFNLIEGARKIVVRDAKSGTDYQATVLANDSDRNLTFLEVKDLALAPIPLAGTAPKVGRRVVALGYNRQADESEQKLAANATLKSGSLSRELRGLISTEGKAPVNQIEHDAAMVPGFEGGPLLDRCAHLIGMNIKSGGAVMPRYLLAIEPEAAVMNALKVDEIIKAANQYGVKYTPASNDCSGGPVPTATPTADATGKPTAVASAVPMPSTSGMSDLLRSTPFLVVLGLLGLAAAAFGLYTMTRREPIPEQLVNDPVAPTQRAPSQPVDEGKTVLIPVTERVVPERTLRLNGRGPSGEPIDFSFSSVDLASRPLTLGVGANADRHFPDNRADFRVSRIHARLAHDGTNFTIEDNKSLNGTFVGGRRLDSNVPMTLVNGDVVSLADIEVRVSID